mmetsp:Transcript_26956/g.33484  ORF Transcript_26956/g.33484 Transcript_26956/m.33484 type:complete len:87 (-) Transcript_26956:1253-1513(-)
MRTVEEMQRMERMGSRYPAALKQKLLAHSTTDWSQASDSELDKARATIEAVRKISQVKPLVAYDKYDEVLPPKCACVNGECLPGES